MNRGGNTSPAAGFTIVETLIVLAVTSALLISAMVAMSGRQARTEFQVATQGAVREFQSIISQIESGRYSTAGTYTCSVGGVNTVTFTAVAAPQGTNGACTYLGLGLVLGQDNTTYRKYVLAGSRLYNGSLSKTITEADPASSDLTMSTHKYTRGLEFSRARYIDTAGVSSDVTAPFVVRLLVDLNGSAGTSGNLAGSNKVTVHATNPWNPISIADTINSVAPNQPVRSLEVCLASTGLSQSVIISIGNGLGNKVTSTVKDGRTCGW